MLRWKSSLKPAAAAPATGITLENSAVTTAVSYSTPTNIDVNIPAVSANDILLLLVTGRNFSEPTDSPPSDWTKIAEQDGTSVSNPTVAAYWKRASSSASATTETWSSFFPNGETYYIWVGAYSGCVTSGSPVDAYGSVANTFSSSLSVDVTTTTADTMIVTMAGCASSTITHTWPDGTELIDTAYPGTVATVSINEKLEATTGSKTRTVTPSTSVNNTMIAVALKGGWSPLDEASLDSYWNPTDESSITGSPAVTTLEDLGSNGNDLSANGTPQTGVRTINSLNVIDFDGVNEYLSNSTYTLNSTVTFVGVFLVDVNGSNVNESILSVDATVDFQIDSGDGGSDWDGRFNPTGTGSVTSWSDSNSKNGVAMIVSVTFDAVANTIDVWYDGDNMVSLSNYTTDLDGTQDLKIMGNRNGSYTANGAFGGMAIFNSADTDIRQKAEGFFAHRFALTGNLVSGHPYISSAP